MNRGNKVLIYCTKRNQLMFAHDTQQVYAPQTISCQSLFILFLQFLFFEWLCIKTLSDIKVALSLYSENMLWVGQFSLVTVAWQQQAVINMADTGHTETPGTTLLDTHRCLDLLCPDIGQWSLSHNIRCLMLFK